MIELSGRLARLVVTGLQWYVGRVYLSEALHLFLWLLTHRYNTHTHTITRTSPERTRAHTLLAVTMSHFFLGPAVDESPVPGSRGHLRVNAPLLRNTEVGN